MSNCTVNSPWDDGICPKSSFGLGYNRPTENITITNCQVSGYDEGTLLDGTRQRTQRGYSHGGPTGRIKNTERSRTGVLETSRFPTASLSFSRHRPRERGWRLHGGHHDQQHHDAGNRQFSYLYSVGRTQPWAGRNGHWNGEADQNQWLSRTVTAESGILIVGLVGHPIEDLSLSNIFIDFVGGGTEEQGQRVVRSLPTLIPSHRGGGYSFVGVICASRDELLDGSCRIPLYPRQTYAR